MLSEIQSGQTIHQFVEMNLAVPNPDQPDRPVNSPPSYGYEIEPSALELIQTYRTRQWKKALATYLENVNSLRVLHHQEREMNRLEVRLPDGSKKWLTAGGQNILIKVVVEEFCPRYTPGGYICYLGDAGEKISADEQEYFKKLGVELDPHGKMPDVVVYLEDRNWLVLIEAVTSHGPIDNKRKRELQKLFAGCTPASSSSPPSQPAKSCSTTSTKSAGKPTVSGNQPNSSGAARTATASLPAISDAAIISGPISAATPTAPSASSAGSPGGNRPDAPPSGA